MTTARAPQAPGALGQALDPAQVQAFLAELDAWLRVRRSELADLDVAVQAAAREGSMTGDMTLSMALWKAVAERHQLLVATWDGGRVGTTERTRLSTLIWGRLDATLDPVMMARAASVSGSGGALAVSLPEACRLSDALVSQVRIALALDEGADENAVRIKDLRAQQERLRDQIALEPAHLRGPATTRWQDLADRIADAAERASRGADVGGVLGPLETQASTFERDLIIGNAQRRATRDRLTAARELTADLLAREAALRQLAGHCVATVAPAPRYAVPDVSALGQIPNDATALDAHANRLARVAQAMTFAQEQYAAALRAHTDLVDELDRVRAQAQGNQVADTADVAGALAAADQVLNRRPVPMPVAEQLVTLARTWVEWQAAHPRPVEVGDDDRESA